MMMCYTCVILSSGVFFFHMIMWEKGTDSTGLMKPCGVDKWMSTSLISKGAENSSRNTLHTKTPLLLPFLFYSISFFFFLCGIHKVNAVPFTMLDKTTNDRGKRAK